MRVSRINIDKNLEVINNALASDRLSLEEKKSIEENNEIIQVLLDRLSRRRLGRKSSERSSGSKKDEEKLKKRKERKQLPSERYPGVPIVERELGFEAIPRCPNCNEELKDSGLHECVETITVLPKKYLIDRLLKKKYKCGSCHSGMLTVPTPSRVVPGSSYSDEMVLDVSLSKYCDLIPMERYAMMAWRNGLEGLPANSLIGLTHHLANFLEVVYFKLKVEVQKSQVVQADETPHRMLEGGGGKKQWYLWGFSCSISCFFEVANTRSGAVASGFLKKSIALYLVSDAFSGYSKAVSEVNAYRKELGTPLLSSAYCNAHARRKFKEAEENFPEETKVFIQSYKEIYRLEQGGKELSGSKALGQRSKMKFYFEEMRKECTRLEEGYSTHSALSKGMKYFNKNYSKLTVCLDSPEVPLDNNQEERLLRSPVVGRKTWYGSHSKRGARTSAVLFSIVEACKLNKVNPREYFPFVVQEIHEGKDPPTPYEYSIRFGGQDDLPPTRLLTCLPNDVPLNRGNDPPII